MNKMLLIVSGVLLIMAGLFLFFLCSASNQLLYPRWKGLTRDLSVCPPELGGTWGPSCGNLRLSHDFVFKEVAFPSINGYSLPGWLVKTGDNGLPPAKGCILLVHGGGGDWRMMTRYIGFFLHHGLDVLTFDLGGAGETSSPQPGLSYGVRKSRDALSAYLYLSNSYPAVYAMGTSVGAFSLLEAAPAMPALRALIAENPLINFNRLLTESSQGRNVPKPFMRLMIGVTTMRGRFDDLLSADNALRLVKDIPIFFIHSKVDQIVPYHQTEELANAYHGPKTIWLPEKGDHAEIWNANPSEYEKRLGDFLDSLPASGGH